MALIQCPICEKVFTDKKSICPNCGYSIHTEDHSNVVYVNFNNTDNNKESIQLSNDFSDKTDTINTDDTLVDMDNTISSNKELSDNLPTENDVIKKTNKRAFNIVEAIASGLIIVFVVIIIGTILYSRFIRDNKDNYSLKLFRMSLIESDNNEINSIARLINNNDPDFQSEQFMYSIKQSTPSNDYPNVTLAMAIDNYLKNVHWTHENSENNLISKCTGIDINDNQEKEILLVNSVNISDEGKIGEEYKVDLYYDGDKQNEIEISSFLHKKFEHYASSNN